MRDGNALSTTQSAQLSTQEASAKALCFSLPNWILVNEMFICQKTSHVSTQTGRSPKLSVMNTAGHFLH